MRGPIVLIAAALAAAAPVARGQAVPYEVVKDGIPSPLTATTPGAAARGKLLLQQRQQANCLQCHAIKGLNGGSSAPPLDGIGASLTVPQLRLSVVDFSQVAAGRAMPSFHKARGDAAPRLSAQEVEDVVAYLATLRL
jgi:sulfur-oxidizing protein SoxX